LFSVKSCCLVSAAGGISRGFSASCFVLADFCCGRFLFPPSRLNRSAQAPGPLRSRRRCFPWLCVAATGLSSNFCLLLSDYRSACDLFFSDRSSVVWLPGARSLADQLFPSCPLVQFLCLPAEPRSDFPSAGSI
jgi:hypothetical protein